jgi:hypothetical protein
MQACTVTWGGRYCPLIPWSRGKTLGWVPGKRVDRREIAEGIIDAFGVDVLVADDAAVVELGFAISRTVQLDQFFKVHVRERPGIPMHYVYGALYRDEFRFPNDAPSLLLPRVHRRDRNRLLQAAMFGEVSRTDPYHLRGLSELGARERTLQPDELYELIVGEGTPLRLTSEYMRITVDRSIIYFVMDAASTADVIDYWNLRAVGHRVLPFPLQWAAQLTDRVGASIDLENKPIPGRLPWTTQGVIMKSRSISDAQFRVAVAGVVAPTANYVVQDWVPRLFPSQARHLDQNVPRDVVAGEVEKTLPFSGRISLEPPALSWAGDLRLGRRELAVSLRVSVLDGSEPARAIPAQMPELARVLDADVTKAVWSDTQGIAYISSAWSPGLTFSIPAGQEVLTAWFRHLGWQATTSGAGKLARQMLRLLPTVHDIGSVLCEPLLRVFAKATRSSTRTITFDELEQTLGRVHRGAADDVRHRHREHLIALGVLKPGLLTGCAHCDQKNWYAFDRLSESVECERCLQTFRLPVARPPDRGQWAFRLRGPFAVEGAGQGGYAVCAAYRALASRSVLEDVSWSTGMELTPPGGVRLEVDFALCARSPKPTGERRPLLAIGEAKTGGAFGERSRRMPVQDSKNDAPGSRFTEEDMRRARVLADLLPGVAFVFATLATELSPKERALLSSFVRRQRRRNLGPVLVLTGTDLLGRQRFTDAWGHGKGEQARLGRALGHFPSFRATCEATNELYLQVPVSDRWPDVDDTVQ